jgi:hypothetical protein
MTIRDRGFRYYSYSMIQGQQLYGQEISKKVDLYLKSNTPLSTSSQSDIESGIKNVI